MSQSMLTVAWGLLVLFALGPIIALVGAYYGYRMQQQSRAVRGQADEKDEVEDDPLIQVGETWVRASQVDMIRVLTGDRHGPRIILLVQNYGSLVLDIDSAEAAHGMARQLVDKIGCVTPGAAK